jgi:hypothetical protein
MRILSLALLNGPQDTGLLLQERPTASANYRFSFGVPNILMNVGLEKRGPKKIPVPGGYIPTQETKQRECWKNVPAIVGDFDSRVHGQSSN